MDLSTSNVAVTKKKLHLKPLDKAQLNAIPMIGMCQGCRKTIDVVPGQMVCPKCGYGPTAETTTATAS